MHEAAEDTGAKAPEEPTSGDHTLKFKLDLGQPLDNPKGPMTQIIQL